MGSLARTLTVTRPGAETAPAMLATVYSKVIASEGASSSVVYWAMPSSTVTLPRDGWLTTVTVAGSRLQGGWSLTRRLIATVLPASTEPVSSPATGSAPEA